MFKWFSKETSPETAKTGSATTLWTQFKSALSQTSHSLVDQVRGIVRETELDEQAIDKIEEALIRADVGLDTAVEIADKIRVRKNTLGSIEAMLDFLKVEFRAILNPMTGNNTLRFDPAQLNVYLIVGVNGAGKTTLIGKLAHRFTQQGQRVIIGAGDTFRAAAEDQLEIWAMRAGADLVRQDGGEASGVIFETLRQAQNANATVVLLDTAGRLQNKFNLMEELRKIRRVIEREMPSNGVFEALLVLDATTGQNALKQAEVFREAVDVTGVALTKLDGSAKGGVILAIAKDYQLPVKLVGVGEGIDDIRDFDADAFIDALFDRT